MSKKVIVAGHICIDITPVFQGKSVTNVSDILKPGKLIQMGKAEVSTGGAVANTGLGMKILGADVTLMGKIGNDEFGNLILEILDKYDAIDGMICDAFSDTSYSVVLAMPGVDRIFLHNPGANHTFCASDVSKDRLKEAVLFHFGYPPLMKNMYEDNGSELVKLFQKAKDAGCATSLDMAAVDPESDAGRADWDLILKRLLPYVDFFVPSVEELCYMLDRTRFQEWQRRAGSRDLTELLDVEKDVIPLAERCMQYGAKVLVIKCGAKGMYYKTADENQLDKIGKRVGLNIAQWAGREGFEASYIPERILSGTGAGDTSIAAFLAAMLEKESLENCMQLAAATGACCVASYDALSGLKSLDELRTKIASGWKKYGEGETL